MTKEELLQKLKECAEDSDTEQRHIDADNALLDYINDPAVTEAFRKLPKWYA